MAKYPATLSGASRLSISSHGPREGRLRESREEARDEPSAHSDFAMLARAGSATKVTRDNEKSGDRKRDRAAVTDGEAGSWTRPGRRTGIRARATLAA